MRYLGSKSKTYKQICVFLEAIRKSNQPFIEPFCGACWITQGMSGVRYASDANKALITLHKAVQAGWIPPSEISEELYNQYKDSRDPNDPMTAFVGFGCSFGGKWFGGFARDKHSNFANQAKNSLLKKFTKLTDVRFSHLLYKDINVADCLIYCDPPYANTTGYGNTGKFDSEEFWSTVREWTKTNTVVISEYVAPEDFIPVLQLPTRISMHTDICNAPRIEKLFMLKK